MIDALVDRVARMRRALSRATLGPLLVRFGLFVAGLAALLTAYPSAFVTSRTALLLPLLAAAPAVLPRSRGATAVILAAVAGWLVATELEGERAALLRLVGLLAFLYLTHNLAALSAVLPYDGVVGLEEIGSWLSRALLVVLASAVAAVLLLAVSGAGRALLAASLAGLTVAVALTALLTWLLRRP